MNVLKELNEGLNHLIQEEIEKSNIDNSKENNVETSAPISTRYEPVEYEHEGEEMWAILDTEAGTKEKPTYVKRTASGNVMIFPNEKSANNFIENYLEAQPKEE